MVQDILNALDSADGELSLVLTDDAEIHQLNRQYLNRDKPTNVIAFPMREGQHGMVTPTLLGDVVISLDTTHREAKAAVHSMDTRLRELIIHGILHLFGYDHEQSAAEEERMFQKSDQLMRLLDAQNYPEMILNVEGSYSMR